MYSIYYSCIKKSRMEYVDDNPVEYGVINGLYKKWMVHGFPQTGYHIFVTEEHTMGFVAENNLTFKHSPTQRTIGLQPFLNCSDWFRYTIMLPFFFQKTVTSNAKRAAATGVKEARLKLFPIPLPPLSEQPLFLKILHIHFV